MIKTLQKIFWNTLGGLSLIFGIIGLLLPIIPQIPFFLFSAYCFSKTSPRFKNWVQSTTIYTKTSEIKDNVVLSKDYRGSRPRVDVTPDN